MKSGELTSVLLLKLHSLIFAVVLAMPAALHAAPFVSDPFTDNSATNTSGGDLLGLVWYRNNTGGATLTVADDASVSPSSKALVLTATSTFRGMLAFFPLQTLAAGQSLTLRFDFRFTTTPVVNVQSFRFGIYNSNNTRQTGDAASATRTDDFGYGIYTDVGTNSAAGTRVFVESAGDDILQGAAPGLLRAVGTAGSSFGCGTAARHSAYLRITRLVDERVLLEGRLDNGITTSGTITTVADRFHSFDTFALINGGGTPVQSFLIDNVTLTLNSPPVVAITAPIADTLTSAPATWSLAATAIDDGAVAKVEFYRGATKIGEDTTAPYTFDWMNVGPGVHSFTAIATDDEGYPGTSAPVDVRVTGGTPDEFDTLRGRWLAQIIGGTSYNLSDPDIANRVASITSQAQFDWNGMLETGGNGRAYLWSDLASATLSSHIATCYLRLRRMTLAYATAGSTLQGNASLLADIEGGLDWMNANRYNEYVIPYNNWYDWEIGSPQLLNDIVVLLYDQLSPTRLMNQMRAIERFVPTAETVTFANVYNTGANRTDKDAVVAVRGVIVKDSAKLFAARDSLSPVFPYVTSGDGFYLDGSFIQHTAHAYTGGYGAELIESMGPTLAMFSGSTWAVTDPNLPNFFRWIHDSFEPLMFRGAMMDCVRGRNVSRYNLEDHVRGHGVISSVLQIAEFAPPADALAYKSMAKAWIAADTSRNFLVNNTLPAVLRAKAVLADGAIAARPEPVAHWRFAGMDRVVHWRPDFVFAVSMCSSRIQNYEWANGENLHGWYQGDGATYLYNSDLDEYSSAYWPTVDSYRLAGTTVDTQARTDAAACNSYSSKSWVGGTDILDLYGSAGFELDATESTLTARKSWFMFDDEIVALGSGIASADNRTIETVVENRRLKVATSALTVDGVAKPTALGWSETMSGVGWAHLEATGGYVFPGGANLKGIRESRTAAWQEINAGGTATANTRNYAALWFDHGLNPSGAGYAYIQLPNKTAAQTAGYTANSDVVVLENSAAAHGVRERRLNITAAHFWEDATHSVGMITSNKKSAVLARETPAQLDVALSDPTQLNTGTITVELARAASGLLSADAGITILQLAPTIRFNANVNGTWGRSLKASFALPLATVTLAATDASAAESGTNAGTFTVARTGNATAELVVAYSLGGTASMGADYFAPTGSVILAEGETAKTVTITPIADSLIEGDEAVTATLAGSAEYLTGGTGSATIVIHDRPIDAWKFAHFASNLSLADDLLDPDGDGLKNLLEYATGGDPNDATPSDLIAGNNGFLSLEYTRSKLATDVNFTIEVSPDLTTWAPATISESILSETSATQRVRATETTPLDNQTRRFIRLRVERL